MYAAMEKVRLEIEDVSFWSIDRHANDELVTQVAHNFHSFGEKRTPNSMAKLPKIRSHCYLY